MKIKSKCATPECTVYTVYTVHNALAIYI